MKSLQKPAALVRAKRASRPYERSRLLHFIKMNFLIKKIKTASAIFRNNGWSGIKTHYRLTRLTVRQKRAYQNWIRKFDTPTENDRENMRRQIAGFSHKPLISVVMPVYNVEEKWLRLCIESVLTQIYENWELCIADDCSPSPHIRRILKEYAAKDERVKVVFRAENGHISAASNSALEPATGEFSALLDHDDELSEHALFYVVREINNFPSAAMIYSDEDKIDESGRRYDPTFKPDWSRDFFYSLNLITHLSVYRTSILREIGGWRVGFEGSQDYDLALRFIEQIPEQNIRHIPHILYHWRAIRGSVAFSADEKPYAHERARQAIRSHLERIGKRAKVSRSTYNLHRVQYDLPERLPKVSIIILGKADVETAVKSLNTLTEAADYQNFEIVLVCPGAAKGKPGVETFDQKIKTVVCEKESEAERYNFGVSQADGEIFCFINNNLRPAAKDWLAEIAAFAAQTEIGAVGGKILSRRETILHGGIVLGIKNFIGFAHYGLPKNFDSYFMRAQVINNFSAVSIDCLATRREVFQMLGGFDAENFPNKFFDIDFCLKLKEKNLRVVFNPYVELIQVSKEKTLNMQKNSTIEERNFFKRKWQKVIDKDPFYNPNLSRHSEEFMIDS